MMYLLETAPPNIFSILIWILGLAIVFTVLKVVFKVARKVLVIGCFGLVALGGLLFILRMLMGS